MTSAFDCLFLLIKPAWSATARFIISSCSLNLSCSSCQHLHSPTRAVSLPSGSMTFESNVFDLRGFRSRSAPRGWGHSKDFLWKSAISWNFNVYGLVSGFLFQKFKAIQRSSLEKWSHTSLFTAIIPKITAHKPAAFGISLWKQARRGYDSKNNDL